MKTLIPNTFNLPVYANKVVTISSIAELLNAYQQAINDRQPFLVLGEGSNTLFTENFSGVVILNRIKQLIVTEDQHYWLINVGSGEIWHQLVDYTVSHNMPGLENLALIPGTVGSAPIQNIGAYGVEFEKFAHYVELLELSTGNILKITDGQYGYRDSIFKSRYKDGYIVVSVGIKLAKHWQANLEYGELKIFDSKSVTAKDIFDKVCSVRRSKLPDPKILGNAGSFFKNPIIEKQQYEQLSKIYLNMPSYPQSNDKYKIAAGWLIDQCGLKGYQIGGAAVHDKQALVLVNKNHAIAQDVIDLARVVRNTVQQKFGISLEPEIRFMDKNGEIDSVALLSK